MAIFYNKTFFIEFGHRTYTDFLGLVRYQENNCDFFKLVFRYFFFTKKEFYFKFQLNVNKILFQVFFFYFRENKS